MKNVIKVFFSFAIILNIISCSKDEVKEDSGIPSELKGHVSDNIRGINISGYKIKLVKSQNSCSNWMCGTTLDEVATAYTDVNGDYSIHFNYKLKDGQSYGIEEQYYGTLYYPEYLSTNNTIQAGQSNVLNINAWKPITLRLNLNITNNTVAPLNVRNEIGNSNSTFLANESIYEQNVTKTIELRSKPNADIKIIFYYGNSVETYRSKTFLYHTTMDDVNILNYNIDCSTF